VAKGNIFGTFLRKREQLATVCTIGHDPRLLRLQIWKLPPRVQWTKSVAHTFGDQGGLDGSSPEAGLIVDSACNLYSAANIGGDLNCSGSPPGGCGTVYKLSPKAAASTCCSLTLQQTSSVTRKRATHSSLRGKPNTHLEAGLTSTGLELNIPLPA